MGGLPRRVIAGLAAQSRGEGVRPLEGEPSVEQVERLQRRDRRGALRLRLAGVGAVERPEEVVEHRARLGLVDHAAEVAGLEGLLGHVDLHVVVHRFEQVEPRAAHGQVEFAGGGQHGIAQHLGLEAARRVAPEVPGLGVDRGGARHEPRSLAVAPGVEDQPMDMLQRPAVIHEFGGEEIEQLRVRGPGAVEAEVARRVHEAGPEMVMPEAVDDDAGGQRMFLGGDPAGEGFAALGLGGVGGQGEPWADEGQPAGGDGFARQHRVAAVLAQGRAGLLELADVTARPGRAPGQFGKPLVPSAGERGDLRGLLGRDVAQGGQGGEPILEGSGEAVVPRGHEGPPDAVERGLDTVAGGQPILETLVGEVAVTAPDHAVDRRRLGEFQLGPAGAFLGGDPAAGVAVFPVVEEARLVDALAARVQTGDRDLRAQGDVPAGRVEHLQLVQAGLRTGSGHGKTDEPGQGRGEILLVRQVRDRGAQVGPRRLDAAPDLLEDGDVRRGRSALRSGAQDDDAPGVQPVDPGGAQAAPAALVLHGGGAIGEAPLVDDGDLGLVAAGREVAVEVEHVARIRRMRGPGAPREPDPHLAAHRRFPQEEVAPGDIGAPPAVALPEVRQPERIPGILGEALHHALVVDDRVAVVRQLDLLREADVGVVGETDGPEVGLGPEAPQTILELGQLCAQLGQTLLGGTVRGPEFALAMPHALQQGHEAIVVGRRDRVELMVVAAGARERRAEEG